MSGDVASRFAPPLEIEAPAGGSANMFNGLPLVELPDDDRTGGDFSAELGRFLSGADLYRRGKVLMTLSERRDRLESVGDHEFRTLVERYVIFFQARVPKRTGDQILRIRRTLGIDTARMAMNSPQLLEQVREIDHLHDVPLPVGRPDGKIELLPAGYDAPSRTLTLKGCDYGKTPCENGAAFLRGLLGEFMFTEPERSLSVAVAAMVSLFARRLLPRMAIRPAFLYTSNAPGGGKTLLADCAIAPVMGKSPRAAFPRREEELEKLLVAEVLAGSECLLFDNVRGRLESAALENLLTRDCLTG
jgi:hypothetical protein